MTIDVKICGLRDEAALKAAVEGGARYVGFVFEPSSPRHITPEQAGLLAQNVPEQVTAVGLFVDPDDDDLRTVTAAVVLNMIQLHGHETPERVAEVRKLTGLPVIKAIHVAAPDDFSVAPAYEEAADMLLFDTKTGPVPSGGTGLSFDWKLLQGRAFKKPWLLAGGLNVANVAEAVALSGAHIIDVSSGVETSPGHKDPEKIRALLHRATTMTAA